MFTHLFILLLRHVIIPAAAILGLAQTFLGLQGATLGVCIVLTVITLPAIVWHLVLIFPNLALLRKRQIMRLVLEVLVEIFSLLGFWIFYVIRFV